MSDIHMSYIMPACIYNNLIIRILIHVCMLQLVHGSNDTSPGRPVLMYHRHVCYCHYYDSLVIRMINIRIHSHTLMHYTGLT